MRAPVNSPYRITLKYGATTSPYSASNPHNGTDFVSDDGKNLSMEDGVVTYAGNTGGKSGYMVVVQGKYRISYSHNKASSIQVKQGQAVQAGQWLGTQGDTGLASGNHVHVVVNGGTIDPLSLVKGGSMGDFSQEAEDRQQALRTIGKEVSVPYKDLTDVVKIVTNIRTMAKRIDELTRIVGELENRPLPETTVLGKGLYEVK